MLFGDVEVGCYLTDIISLDFSDLNWSIADITSRNVRCIFGFTTAGRSADPEIQGPHFSTAHNVTV